MQVRLPGQRCVEQVCGRQGPREQSRETGWKALHAGKDYLAENEFGRAAYKEVGWLFVVTGEFDELNEEM